jgi:hypothetical protein
MVGITRFGPVASRAAVAEVATATAIVCWTVHMPVVGLLINLLANFPPENLPPDVMC